MMLGSGAGRCRPAETGLFCFSVVVYGGPERLVERGGATGADFTPTYLAAAEVGFCRETDAGDALVWDHQEGGGQLDADLFLDVTEKGEEFSLLLYGPYVCVSGSGPHAGAVAEQEPALEVVVEVRAGALQESGFDCVPPEFGQERALGRACLVHFVSTGGHKGEDALNLCQVCPQHGAGEGDSVDAYGVISSVLNEGLCIDGLWLGHLQRPVHEELEFHGIMAGRGEMDLFHQGVSVELGGYGGERFNHCLVPR